MSQYKPKNINNILQKVKDNLFGLAIGIILSSIITLTVWGFAYFGWTDLALPQHFEYENFDQLVKSNLPVGYNYASYNTTLRMNNENSILIVGRNNEFYQYEKDNRSDIILVVDKTKDNYKISYKFEPNNPIYSYGADGKTYSGPIHVNSIRQKDISDDGREEVILGWSTLGASWSPPLIMVMTSNGRNISSLGVDRYQPVNNTFIYTKTNLENKFDKTIFSTVSALFFDIKDNQLVLINRTDDKCHGCENEAIYSTQFFKLFNNKTTFGHGNTENINGYNDLKTFLTN